ncbi:GT2 family glycosyltransferase [Pedobacter sp. CAN_A7]|uniref:glycosyltransferase n=1 Tax=Pedobacter sp. CAN_A7 TaxID=2787722 RepID=UPI0018C94089
MKKTVATVLTFNRIALLTECIKCIRNQTVHVDHIIVINNASTDGTKEWLEEQPDIEVITLTKNFGGSAGFKIGLQEAYQQEFEWIWMMDDDAFPEIDCLENLMMESELLPDKNIVLAPVVVEGDKVDHMHRGYIDFDKIQFPLQVHTNDKIFQKEGNLVEISFASFIGLFIKREIISKINFPHHNYYIFQEDMEYSIRIVKAGFPIYLVKNAVVYHKIRSVPELKNSDASAFTSKSYKKEKRTLAQYYYDKREKYQDISKINPLLFISKRNWLWTIMHHNGMNMPLFLFLVNDMCRSIAYVVFSRSNNKLLFNLYYAMYSQGLSGKFDNSTILTMPKNTNI